MKNIYTLIFVLITFSCTTKMEQKATAKTEVSSFKEMKPNYNPEAKLAELGIVLKTPGTPVASYVHAVRTGNLLFLSGKGPKKADGKNIVGKLGADLTIEEGYEAARVAGINQLAVLKSELGNLLIDCITKIFIIHFSTYN